MFKAILDFLRSLPPAAVVGLVFLIPALESALVLGLLLPGELAVVTGGILAAHSKVPLGWVLAAAVAGSILGDSLGFLVGRKFRPLIVRRLPSARWKKTEAWLKKKGPVAVFLARFTAFVRTIMPPVAGAAKLPYRKFLPWSVAAGIVWGVGSVLLGYYSARNAAKILHWSSGGIAILVLAAGLVAWLVTRRRGARRRRAHAHSA
jgi:undecaprenyl-diphosphatase